MYKYILESAGNINWMAIFALLTFFMMFLISSIAIIGTKSKYIDKMANLPLEPSDGMLSPPNLVDVNTTHECIISKNPDA